jgi:hypothetical protein
MMSCESAVIMLGGLFAGKQVSGWIGGGHTELVRP